ncbi:serine/threonine-protein phosphatase 4 regulatory subunit 3A isoform X1 [Nematostella vectensis]|uniref:serine/threonine-protein phosphatase 4 regulatory subunit 3A isoform X1 n=1 Tax=Nematostella vectensis TaxID=45351 RepID=UPI00207753A2|nr:serine/threonine-protein phosphatase 4 regulatory subunit 3A isoform X1 [Nematostella vectensis]
MANTRRRVKVYTLNEDRQWDDRGTGHVSSSYVERLQGMSIMVRSEEDGSILLESKIQSHTAYQKQQETLIVWSEGENCDLALSFQEKAGCDEIWEKVCQVQGRDPSCTITQEILDDDESEDRFEEVLDTSGPIELPPCELSKLEEISEFLSGVPPPAIREKIALAIEQDNYIKKLLDLFHMCEDLENIDGLHHLYDIFKSLFFMNKPSLLEIMLADDMLFDVIGCLEYDPNHPEPRRHRRFLRETAHFTEVLPITNAELVAKIHQTFRVQYIYDVILPPPTVFEENMLASLHSYIFFNKIEIVTHLQEDDKFLRDLFMELNDDETSEERRMKLVAFLKELVHFASQLQVHHKDEFFKTVSFHGLLPALEMLLAYDNKSIKQAAVEMISQLVDISPYLVRDFIMKDGKTQEDEMLVNQLIDYMISDGDSGDAYQLASLIKSLLDPENMALGPNKMEKSEFLSFFYKHSMHVLTAPLFAATADKVYKDDYVTSVTLGHIIELLTFCIEHHTYHIKNYVINRDLLRRALATMRSKHKFLVLNALRFCRKIVGLKDEFYNRYIIKGKLVEPIITAFKENGNRYNLLNSAIVELFEFIRVEDIKSLSSHVCEEYRQFFKDVDYVSTFKGLVLRYEQEKDRKQTKLSDGGYTVLASPVGLFSSRGPNHGIIHVNSRFRRDARSMEEEEEMWFDQTEEENGEEAIVPQPDPLPAAQEHEPDFKSRKTFVTSKINDAPLVNKKSPLMGLVDYPDDDEEDDDDESGSSPAKRARLNST